MAHYDQTVTELAQELQEALVKARDRRTLDAPDSVIAASEALLAALGSDEEPEARSALQASLDAHPVTDAVDDDGVERIASELLQVLDSLK
jgi:hypothetical protein